MSRAHLQLTEELVDYVRQVSPPEPDFLRRLREETASHPQGRMQITPEQGRLMGMLIRMLNGRKAIEIGVFTGYSSISVALALPPDGKLIACDVSDEYTSVARRYWAEAGVDSKIELHLAPALETLKGLMDFGESGQFDFAFIDADKENYLRYYEACLVLLRQGGLIAIDNTLWSGRVADPSNNEIDTLAIRKLNEFVKSDTRVWPCMLPIGDGLTLALKK